MALRDPGERRGPGRRLQPAHDAATDAGSRRRRHGPDDRCRPDRPGDRCRGRTGPTRSGSGSCPGPSSAPTGCTRASGRHRTGSRGASCSRPASPTPRCTGPTIASSRSRTWPTAPASPRGSDGTVIRCRLVEATFHDGTPVTAEDVAYTYQVFQHRPPFLPDVAGRLREVRVVDGRTVDFVLSERDPTFLTESLQLIPILPRHVVEASFAEFTAATDGLEGGGPDRAGRRDRRRDRPRPDGVLAAPRGGLRADRPDRHHAVPRGLHGRGDRDPRRLPVHGGGEWLHPADRRRDGQDRSRCRGGRLAAPGDRLAPDRRRAVPLRVRGCRRDALRGLARLPRRPAGHPVPRLRGDDRRRRGRRGRDGRHPPGDPRAGGPARPRTGSRTSGSPRHPRSASSRCTSTCGRGACSPTRRSASRSSSASISSGTSTRRRRAPGSRSTRRSCAARGRTSPISRGRPAIPRRHAHASRPRAGRSERTGSTRRTGPDWPPRSWSEGRSRNGSG